MKGDKQLPHIYKWITQNVDPCTPLSREEARSLFFWFTQRPGVSAAGGLAWSCSRSPPKWRASCSNRDWGGSILQSCGEQLCRQEAVSLSTHCKHGSGCFPLGTDTTRPPGQPQPLPGCILTSEHWVTVHSRICHFWTLLFLPSSPSDLKHRREASGTKEGSTPWTQGSHRLCLEGLLTTKWSLLWDLGTHNTWSHTLSGKSASLHGSS